MRDESLVEVLDVNGVRVEIHYDVDAEDPRGWDNVGKMVCWHRRYQLGDEMPEGDPQEWLRYLACERVGADEDKVPDEHIQRIIDKYFVMLPLYLYDHSGITMSTGPFHCPWDSGQVGWIYCTAEDAIKEFGSIENAEKGLRQEVETYDEYLTGQVYGYVIDHEGEQDSCWGFFGLDFCKEQARDAAKSVLKRVIANREEDLNLMLDSLP